jgi:uncharacterized repeat protein (TIGR01451 family)
LSWDAGLRAGADLGISKASEPDPYIPGQPLTYTLVVTNAGPLTARNVSVSDTLPAGVVHSASFVEPGSDVDPDGHPRSCNYVSPTVTCDLVSVAAGESVTVTIVTTVTSGYVGVLRNRAEVLATTLDPDADNDAAAHQSQAAPVGGVTIPMAGFALLARWLELLGLVLLAGGASLLGYRRGIGR